MTTLTETITAALAQFSSASRLYALTVGDGSAELGSGGLLVEAFAADDLVQGIGGRDVIVLSTDAHISLAPLLGQPASLEVSLSDGTRTRFEGDISEVAMLGSEGGLARYRLRMSPWMWRLGQVRNSRVWQDKSVIEIVEEVFQAYAPVAKWRWSDETEPFMAGALPRSYCCQYRESDLDFVQRLLTEEGLAWRFEQTEDGPGAVLFADSSQLTAVPDDASSAADGGIRFHNVRAGEKQDTVQALHTQRSISASLTTVLSYDYKAKQAVAASVPSRLQNGSMIGPLESYDVPGQYAYASAAQAQRYAGLQMQGKEARAHLWSGRSTLRTLRAGTRLTVLDAPLKNLGQEPAFALLRVTSVGVNNLPAPAQQALAELFGPMPELLQEIVRENEPAEFALVVAQARKSGYANCFDAIAADITWRPQLAGSEGRSHPRPTAFGAQSAIVVGADGNAQASGADELYCDKLGRVRIRFHWQDNADATCWVRVAQRSAGGGMGSQFLPRIGQEVFVQFIENDIDRPIIVGALYNGQGEGGIAPTPGGQSDAEDQSSRFDPAHDHAPSAQGNIAGGNSPLWHGASGDSKGHRNGAAQWGVRSKEFGGSGYNQLLFDDTDAQGRIQLKSSHAATELNLGHLVHAADNFRGSLRGQGAELRTDAYGAVRAGAGLLISSYKINHSAASRDPAGDNAPGIAMLKQAVALGEAFNKVATTHKTVALASHVGAAAANASALDDKAAPLKAMLKAVSGMVAKDDLDQARADADKKNTAPGDDKLPHSSDAIIAIAAKGGLGVVAGQSVQLANGETVTLVSGQDTQFVTGGQMRVHTGQAIGMLGGAMAPGEGGIGLQLIAAKDAIDIQAQAGTVSVQARDDVNIISANAHIDWAAAKSISLSTAGGANITIDGGNITVQCPGKITIHAGKKSFSGGERNSYTMPHLPRGEPTPSDMEFRHFTEWGEAIAGRSFIAKLSDGSVRKGTLDAEGFARLSGVPAGVTAIVKYLPDVNPAKSTVQSEMHDDVNEFFGFELPPASAAMPPQSPQVMPAHEHPAPVASSASASGPNAQGLLDRMDAGSTASAIIGKLKSEVSLGAAKEIANGGAKGIAYAGAASVATGVVSKEFTNLTGKMFNFPGVQGIAGDKSQFTIPDHDAFIEGVSDTYAKAGQVLNPLMADNIRDFLVKTEAKGETFANFAGVPGLHAEVQAVNDLYNKLDDPAAALKNKEIAVATYKLGKTSGGCHQGGEFLACSNCGGIIPEDVDVVTGRRYG